MQEIRCLNCGKVLCEAAGEVRKICPRCKEVTHVVVTSTGVINLLPHDKQKCNDVEEADRIIAEHFKKMGKSTPVKERV